MLKWTLETTDKYDIAHKRYVKKKPKILKALLANLTTYFDALVDQKSPQKITAGFIHNEPQGVKAIDQKGGDEKLQETRLYVYPDTTIRIIHLITIGDKNNQAEDIKFCNTCVKQIKERGR